MSVDRGNRDAQTLATEHAADIASLDDFGRRMIDVIQRLLSDSQIRTHSVVHRAKQPDSLRRKVESSPEKYRDLSDITDRLGIRIITYFPDDVDAVAKVIEDNFQIDSANSVDRRMTMEPDRFGYLSLHYIVQLSQLRRDLPEYQAQGSTKFEIQVRSILQHTWAEIEHDLGYKSTSAVPRPVRRRFSRLAGLLEIADDEFASIRDELTTYAATVHIALDTDPSGVGIDRESVLAFIASSDVLLSLDGAVLPVLGSGQLRKADPAYAANRAEELSRAGFTSLAEVEASLATDKEQIVRFVRAWNGPGGRPSSGAPAKGVGLFYLFLFRLATLARGGQLNEFDVRGGFQSQRWGELLDVDSLRSALTLSLADAERTDHTGSVGPTQAAAGGNVF